jgi:hypothetical protein
MKNIICVLAIIGSCFNARAQDSTVHKNKWHFLVEPYLMFPNLNGTTGVGELPDVAVDANPGDVFSHLQIGAMLNIEASKGKWAITSDVTYMHLTQDAKTGTVIKSGEVDMKQTAWEVAGFYALSSRIDVGVGGMLNSINADVNITTTINRSKGLTETWVDPMIIARLKSKPAEKFIYLLRGEIGGFGIGSGFAWQVQAYAGYRFSKLFQLTGGYRVIGIDYDKGSGNDRFLYDMDTFGPVVRLGFNF